MAQKYVLETKDICKEFPGVIANDNVDMYLNEQEILAILGENGAGKTTLLNIIYGLYAQDCGEVYIDGKLSPIKNPNDAIKAGIGMVHQHFMLVPVFSVLDNIILGSEILNGPFIDRNKARKEIIELSNSYGLAVDPDMIVEDIPVGVQQRVEILKALYRHANILILDEPTAVLTPQETEDLFNIMRQLKERGVSIVFITHKLKEVLDIADRIIVMRRGAVVGETYPSQTSKNDLANMMVGREVLLQVDKGQSQPKEVIFNVNHLTVKGTSQMHCVHNVSFNVRAGEILGLAGVQGNGQTELVEAITGLRKPDEGEIQLAGNPMPFLNPRVLIEGGIAHIPEDRQKHGLVLPYELTDNFVLCTYYQEPFSKGAVRNEEAILENAISLIERFDVRTPSPRTIAGNLSGGNQQKVIVGRELSRPVKLVVANQPTRGLDVGSIEYIHKTLVKMRDQGVGVLLISAELDEIMGLSDRIAVMYRGQIVATVNTEDTFREELGLLMAGSEKEHLEEIVL